LITRSTLLIKLFLHSCTFLIAAGFFLILTHSTSHYFFVLYNNTFPRYTTFFFLLVQLHNPLLDDSFKSALFQFIQRIIVFSSSMQYIPVIPVVSFTHLMLFFTKPQKNKNKVFFFSLLSFFLGLSSPSLTRLHRLNHVNPRLVRINPPDW